MSMAKDARVKSMVKEWDRLTTKNRSGKITKAELKRLHVLTDKIAEKQGFTKYLR